ncbi:unnamed protein product [Thlaspi arvense]|uniref:Acid phosphatase n=1 Tax=Thlaspi arvense TaxID=13288 RepID=A0AAU9T5F2_THLAR|nr:unnamed protein product [Thlaspi arvense]
MASPPPRGISISFFLLSLFSLLINPAISARNSIIKLPGSDGSRSAAADTYCQSWRLAVETNNVGTWDVIPSICVDSVAGYLNGDQYGSDYDIIADYALAFAKTVQISGDGKDVWIFDIDETLLTNIDYYKAHGYGGPDDQGKSATNYKSEQRSKLIEEGFKIRGNTGDQWSDLLGFAVADRSFKVPNPMYYIP